MKKSNNKYRIRRVSECLTDNQEEDLCSNTNICDINYCDDLYHDEANCQYNYESEEDYPTKYDDEYLKDKIFKLRLEQETNLNNRNYFDSQIETIKREIDRLLVVIKSANI